MLGTASKFRAHSNSPNHRNIHQVIMFVPCFRLARCSASAIGIIIERPKLKQQRYSPGSHSPCVYSITISVARLDLSILIEELDAMLPFSVMVDIELADNVREIP